MPKRGLNGEVGVDPNVYEQYRRTQVGLIRSESVLAGALHKEGILDLPTLQAEKGTPKQFLSDEIFVVAPLGSEVVQIKMRGKDPQQLVKIVNAVTDSYMDNVVNAEHTDALYEQSTLADQLKSLKKDRERKVAEQANEENNGGKNFEVEFARLSQRMSALTSQITERRVEIGRLAGKIAIAQHRRDNDKPVPDGLLQQIMDKDPQVQDVKKNLMYLKVGLQQALQVSKNPQHDPSVRSLQGQVDSYQKQLDELYSELKPQYLEQIKMYGTGQNMGEVYDLDELMAQKASYEEQLKPIQEEYEQVSNDFAKLQRSNARLKQLESDVRDLDIQIAKLQDRLNAIEIELKLPARVIVYERATLPENSTQIFRILITLFAGIVAFVVGSGAIVGMEYQAQRLNSSGELSTRTGLRVLGTVPNLAALSNTKNLNGSAALQGILAESVDSIRTMLLSQSRADAPHVILVTSAGDREGKTTVASHLAASLARSGRRTLLVDGDLRSPTAHTMFGASLNPGLCEILRGETALEAGIQPTQVDGLMVLAAGQCDYQAIAALSQQHLNEVLEKARQQFEFVVFDAAPVLTYGDTLLMGVHVDAAVLSVRRDVSQLHKVHEAKERLELVGIRVLGAVLNGISESSRRPAFALPSPN
jgi:capsular exopolysaccharide synthesis family protein